MIFSAKENYRGCLALIVSKEYDHVRAFFQVGTPIAVLAEEGEDWKTVGSSASAESPAETAEVAKSTDSADESSGQPSGGSTPGTEVKMPSLSPTMTEGTIVKWCKKVRILV